MSATAANDVCLIGDKKRPIKMFYLYEYSTTYFSASDNTDGAAVEHTCSRQHRHHHNHHNSNRNNHHRHRHHCSSHRHLSECRRHPHYQSLVVDHKPGTFSSNSSRNTAAVASARDQSPNKKVGKIQLKIFYDSSENRLCINVLNIHISVYESTKHQDVAYSNHHSTEDINSVYCTLHLLHIKPIDHFTKLSEICNLDKSTGLFFINEAFTFEPVSNADLNASQVEIVVINYTTKENLGKVMIDLSKELFDNQPQYLDIYSIKANFDQILQLNRKTGDNKLSNGFNIYNRSSSLMTDNSNENSYRNTGNFDSNNNLKDQSQGTSNEQLNQSGGGNNRRRKLPTIPQNKPASPNNLPQPAQTRPTPPQQQHHHHNRITPSPPSNASDHVNERHQNRLDVRSSRPDSNSKSDSETLYDVGPTLGSQKRDEPQVASSVNINTHEKRPSFKLKKQTVSLDVNDNDSENDADSQYFKNLDINKKYSLAQPSLVRNPPTNKLKKEDSLEKFFNATNSQPARPQQQQQQQSQASLNERKTGQNNNDQATFEKKSAQPLSNRSMNDHSNRIDDSLFLSGDKRADAEAHSATPPPSMQKNQSQSQFGSLTVGSPNQKDAKTLAASTPQLWGVDEDDPSQLFTKNDPNKQADMMGPKFSHSTQNIPNEDDLYLKKDPLARANVNSSSPTFGSSNQLPSGAPSMSALTSTAVPRMPPSGTGPEKLFSNRHINKKIIESKMNPATSIPGLASKFGSEWDSDGSDKSYLSTVSKPAATSNLVNPNSASMGQFDTKSGATNSKQINDSKLGMPQFTNYAQPSDYGISSVSGSNTATTSGAAKATAAGQPGNKAPGYPDKLDGTLSDSATIPETTNNKKRRPSMAKALVILGLSKKSNSASNLAHGKRFGFARSEEIGVSPELRNRNLSPPGGSGDSSGGDEKQLPKTRLWSGAMKLPHEAPFNEFIESLGPGQKVSRQVLGSACLGELQMSMFLDKQQMLNVEIIRARNLKPRSGYKITPAAYVKLYLFSGRYCIAKLKTAVARRTLEPMYQETLKFNTNHRGCVLQVTVWGDYGKLDRKVFMGVAQIYLDDLNLSSMVIGWYKLYSVTSIISDFTLMTGSSADLSGTVSGYSIASDGTIKSAKN